ncbi:Uncharacterised protein [Citrobacter koseri]|uniref:Uncharacterized protein n=1 Tax=Citrobacter koseri (strain ATCC BAA-895 / CDC 4225-83 / SGSC4696) TaxID=290338 RepID=A8AIW4_CITK8|nr:hypothetical protein CKO_02306 [Citrobacter koseri ATCC BAA-895]SUX86523.1 Uncharacterised protein [Citrobacter koseri]
MYHIVRVIMVRFTGKVMLFERDSGLWKCSVTRKDPLDIANRKEFLINF